MTNKKYILKNKRKFFGFLLFTSIFMFILIYSISVSGYEDPQYQSVVIQRGDTLWSIAEKYCDNSDIREYIYNIKRINKLDSASIYENTAILIPLEK